MVGKIHFDSRSPGVLELSKDRAQEPCIWRGSVSIQSALFWGGLRWEEGTVSWAWGGVSMFERESPEGREMPDFIFLILCPAQALIVHFVDQTLELLLGHWTWLTNYDIVQIALGGVFTHSSRFIFAETSLKTPPAATSSPPEEFGPPPLPSPSPNFTFLCQYYLYQTW